MDTKQLSIYDEVRVLSAFHSYLKEFGLKSRSEIKDNDSDSIKEKLFLACTRDFVEYRIDFDLFSSILGILWMINETTFDTVYSTEVEDLCHYGSEYQWYIRNSPETNSYWITDILEYYKKNKYKIGVQDEESSA